MLTPEYLDGLTDDILGMYDSLNESIIEDIARRIVKTGMVTETAVWQAKQLQEMGALYDDVLQRVSEVSGMTEEELKRLFEEAGVENIRYENDIMSKIGFMPIELKQSETMMKLLRAGLEKTSRDLSNLTLTTALQAQNAYYNATNLAYLQVSSGVLSYQEAVKKAVLTTAREGVTVLYPSGHVDKVDVAVRRAVLTGVNQTAAKISLEYCDEAECDFVETTAHSGARPSHAVWQGRVFCRSGKSDLYPPFSETGYGTGAGLCGWNCRHSFHAFFPGISVPAYTQDMLDDYNARKFEYQGKKLTDYECSQLQRVQERKIRETRRQLAACDAVIDATDDEGLKNGFQMEFENKSVLLKNQEADLKNFCKQTKRSVDSARLQVYAVKNEKGQIIGFDRSVSQKAVQANIWKVSNKSKFTERLVDYNAGQKDVINHWSLQRNLNKSDIGKEIVQYITEHPELKIKLLYKVDNPMNLFGYQNGNEISIYVSDTKTVQKTAETIIHEVTHYRYDIGESKWAECFCVAQEMKHRLGRNELTANELRDIIKSVKKLYPDLPWR
ncbi:MAG: capsid protein [Collinsella tanakaei]|nr:MAG: capsid protein [Collinsella tanakaei]